MDTRYNSAIHGRLQAYAQVADWQGMAAYLRSLSNSAFRTASYVMAERVLPSLAADDYWGCFADIALADRKAFLVTFLKAAKALYADGKLDFSDSRFVAFARAAATQEVSLDRQKTLKALLPVLRTSGEAQMLLDNFCGANYEKQLGYLVAADESLPGYHAMFLVMRRLDHKADTLTKTLLHVLRRATPMAYNFVSIARAYFGIEGIKGSFSLVLQPYELSRMEAGYDGFADIINRFK